MKISRLIFAFIITGTLLVCHAHASYAQITLSPNTSLSPYYGSISSAISDLNVGGTLILQSGDYYISSQLTVTQSLHIKGQGIGTSRVHFTGSQYALYLKRLTPDTTYRLEGFTLDTSSSGATVGIYAYADTVGYYVHNYQSIVMNNVEVDNYLISLQLNGCYNSEITSCTFYRSTHTPSIGVYVETPSMNSCFSSCTITGFDTGIWIALYSGTGGNPPDSEGIEIVNSTLSDYHNGIYAPGMAWLGVFYNTMTNRSGDSSASALLLQNVSYGLVLGNIIHGSSSQGSGIYTQGLNCATVSLNDVYTVSSGITVTNNGSTNSDQVTVGNNYLYTSGTGIDVESTTTGSLVGQNTFTSCTTNQIVQHTSGTDPNLVYTP